MEQLKRLIKKYWILFSTFILINIFFLSVIINILNYEQDLKIRNSLISKDAKTILFETPYDIKINDLINILKDRKVILEGNVMMNNDEDKTKIIGVYYNYNIDKTYPLAEGRMFTLEEIEGREKVALVGYNLKDQIKNQVIKIQDQDYKVVGILGNKSSNSLVDSIYINMNSQDFNLNRKSITIDVIGENVSYYTRKIYEQLNETTKVVMEISEPIVEPLDEAISSNSIYLIMGALACISLISTVINISSYWIEKEKVIIGIKSLVGGSKSMIFINLFIEYQFVIIASIIASYLILGLCGNLRTINLIIALKSLITIMLIDVIVSIISVIPSIVKINKMNINSIIKERI
ncbi:ABC transporter permease [Clostridium isatidis]|uniref:ABC transporter permease n=1 Tax=Clostridium isatidis TaxID=182773 RepID=UPI003AAC5C1B